MKLVPLVLPIPLFALIITIVAIAIPCHEASANDFLSGYLERYNRGEGEVYGPPPPPSEPGSYDEALCCLGVETYGPPPPPSAPNSYYNALCCLVGETYGPPLQPPPVESNYPFCIESLDEATYALTYCCYSNNGLDVDIGVWGSYNPYNPEEDIDFGPCVTFSLRL